MTRRTKVALTALLLCLGASPFLRPPKRTDPVVKVEIITDAFPAGIDTALMDRPAWGVLKAKIFRQSGALDTVDAIHWRVGDSTVVHFRKMLPQSVVIEAPPTAKLGTTWVSASYSARYDTVIAVVREGIAGIELDSTNYNVLTDSTHLICTYWRSITGQRFVTSTSAAACPQ